jgi:triosephosphate isomerase
VNPFRRPLVAGNWKMNKGGRDACDLAHDVAARTHGKTRVDVVVAPPFTALAAVAHQIDEVRGSIDVTENFGVGIAAQNLHAKSSGAFTGEVSAPFLRDSGVTWVIIGHSERRQLFGETDEGVAEKTKSALEGNLRPIVCVGETLAEREAGETLAVVERQVRAFVGVLASAPGTGVIAYEPVWAIGTGKVASPADAQEVHARIRELLMEVSEELAETKRILNGGSVKGDNALAEDDGDIDGDNDESLAEDDGGTDESLAEDAPEAPAAEATAQAEPSEPASDSDEEPLT